MTGGRLKDARSLSRRARISSRIWERPIVRLSWLPMPSTSSVEVRLVLKTRVPSGCASAPVRISVALKECPA